MTSRVKHSYNGKFYGMWYETATGNRLYLAHRKADQVYRARHAWCLDISTLEQCRAEGVKAVGVIRRDGSTRLVWLTLVDDFFDSPHSFPHRGDTAQRGLPLSRFRVNPLKSAKVIASAVKLR